MLSVRPEVLAMPQHVTGHSLLKVLNEFGVQAAHKLSLNESPIGPSPRVVEAVRAAAGEIHFYPERLAEPLRDALAAKLGLPSEWIAIGNGSEELIRLLASCYIHAGERVLIPECSFPLFGCVSQLFGARVEKVALKNEAMDLEAMGAAAQGARMIFLCNPNNPTGGVFQQADWERFLSAVPADTLILLDEAYHEFDESGFDALPYLTRHPNLVVTRTFSKAYGMAGLRAGYGIAQPELWQPVRLVREPYSVNALGQVAALAALADEAYLEANLANNRAGKAFLLQALRAMRIPAMRTETNFLLVDTGHDAESVFIDLLRQGVVVRPGGPFGRPTSLRVSVGTPEANQRFVEALAASLERISGDSLRDGL